ncbi:hypothetical protein N7466_003460 [Penicillium verhagenii]|uniref:uncharacterized protein n=1 Tax=Penicillium verhagenii TaxID=1562060 RepID=UPI0025454FE5|nr:uncharacterized protein N7466_003460 [Penicillium verhagenii]KAJ5937010.1 hypothetical protein N7466_003460 [Penicillium verhagenii]
MKQTTSRFEARPARLLTLDMRIIKRILDHLPTPDFICVLLTCKFFFFKVGSKQLGRLIPPQKREMLCPNWKLEQSPRMQLLRQLENTRWRYCSECWNLHARSEWCIPLAQSRIPFKKSQKGSGHLSLGAQVRSCMPFPGEVDICPCLTITFPDKIRLIEKIKLARDLDPSKTQYCYNKALYHPVSGRRRNPVGHACVVRDHPLIKLEIYTYLAVDENTQELYVSNCYAFEKRELGSEGQNAVIFPQNNKQVGKWLNGFFAEAGSSFSVRKHGPQHFDIVKPMEDPRCFAIRSVRNFGKAQWPDREWKKNCR